MGKRSSKKMTRKAKIIRRKRIKTFFIYILILSCIGTIYNHINEKIQFEKSLKREHEAEIVYDKDGNIIDDSARKDCEWLKGYHNIDIHRLDK